jgi:hypothetical protein
LVHSDQKKELKQPLHVAQVLFLWKKWRKVDAMVLLPPPLHRNYEDETIAGLLIRYSPFYSALGLNSILADMLTGKVKPVRVYRWTCCVAAVAAATLSGHMPLSRGSLHVGLCFVNCVAVDVSMERIGERH